MNYPELKLGDRVQLRNSNKHGKVIGFIGFFRMKVKIKLDHGPIVEREIWDVILR